MVTRCSKLRQRTQVKLFYNPENKVDVDVYLSAVKSLMVKYHHITVSTRPIRDLMSYDKGHSVVTMAFGLMFDNFCERKYEKFDFKWSPFPALLPAPIKVIVVE